MAISVDRVYRKVLAILNKESRGFLTPDEFSKIGSQAQLDLLDKAFHDYNRAVTKQSVGRTGQGYADITKKLQDRIDPFYALEIVTLTSGVGTLPTFYNIVNVSKEKDRLIQLERIEKSKLSFLLSSPLTAPSTTFPIYYITGSNITVNPSSFTQVHIDYISVPPDPVWASTVDANGALTFDSTGASGVSFVDFTLHPSSEVDLILEILRYVGVTIKDPSVIQSAMAETNQKIQLENQ